MPARTTPKPLFTVFTPAYNRAHTLHRVYESLKLQTLNDFEWVIVDDGSTDDTRSLVEGWIAEAKLPSIRYFFQRNQGMHAAINLGVAQAHGTWFLKLDSDDSCAPTSLGRFQAQWLAIPDAQRSDFSSLTCLCNDQQGQLVGSPFPCSPLDCSSLEMLYHYRTQGEKWGANLTSIMRQFPYPSTKTSSYIPEGYIWNKIGRHYLTRYFNEPLRTYWQEEGDQITTHDPAKHAPGHVLYLREALNQDLKWLPHAPCVFLKYSCNFLRFQLHDRGLLALLKDAFWGSFRLALLALGAGVGVLLWLNDRRKSRAHAKSHNLKPVPVAMP